MLSQGLYQQRKIDWDAMIERARYEEQRQKLRYMKYRAGLIKYGFKVGP